MAFEVGGFVMGFNSIIPVIEKSFQIWQSISEARGFGDELISLAAQLSMEYYRFIAWARVSQALRSEGEEDMQTTTSNILHPKDRAGSFPLEENLTTKVQAPILDAAARIVAILEEVSKIAEKYAATRETNGPPNVNIVGSGHSKSLAQGLSTILPIAGVPTVALNKIASQQRRISSVLQKQTSFRVKLTFGSKPWDQSDKKILTDSVSKLCYWNDRLEGLLPQALRNTIQSQALPGQLLLEENKTLLNDLILASEHKNNAVSTHAKLWRERITFSQESEVSKTLTESYRQPSASIIPIPGLKQSKSELSLADLELPEAAPIRVAVEWYQYHNLNWSVEESRLANSRLAELVHISLQKYIPRSLRVLEGVCFTDDGSSLGFVTNLPIGASSSKQPLSLFSLLARDKDACKNFRPPDLGQRLKLAQTIAGAVYSFSLVRWYHKDFNSRNITLFRDTSPRATVTLNAPYITGFSISRPENEGEKSLDKERERAAVYLHPDLRLIEANSTRPRYSRKYEIYALGVVLFEIGIWQTLEKVVERVSEVPPGKTMEKTVSNVSVLPPRKFMEKVVERCEKDLPFYMGNRYCDVVMRCLTCADEDADETAASLDSIYWSIVLELAKCG